MIARATTIALIAGMLLSGSAAAFDRPGALGPGGEIYLTRTGTYGVLFPKGKLYPASNPVLALEVSRSGQASARVLVPGTEGAEIESSPFVVYEETSSSLYVLWQTKISSVNRLILRSFKDGSFGPPIEVRTGTFNMNMSAPQVAITRDEFFVPTADGGSTTAHRMLLHIIWWEESPPANKVLYAPITLIEGIYSGWHPVYSLNSFDRSPDDPAAAAETLSQLYRAPRIQTGRNDHSVVISFANERNGRLAVLDVSLLPGEISFIADKIRAHVIEIGYQNRPSARTIADKIRAHVIEIGRLKPQVVSFLSNDIHEHILAVGPQYVDAEDYEGLADELSDYATRAASTLLGNGRLGEEMEAPSILRLANSDDDELGAPRLQLRKVFSRPAPHTAAAPTTIFASEDGKVVLVAWDVVNQVRYLESSPVSMESLTPIAGWTEVLVVNLNAELTRDKAYEFLEQRLRR